MISTLIAEELQKFNMSPDAAKQFTYPLLACAEIENMKNKLSKSGHYTEEVKESLTNIASGVPNLFRDAFLFAEMAGGKIPENTKIEIIRLAGTVMITTMLF